MHGYYVYPSDGHGYWGVGLYRNAELPVLVTRQVYKAPTKVKVRYLRMKQHAAEKATKSAQAKPKSAVFKY